MQNNSFLPTQLYQGWVLLVFQEKGDTMRLEKNDAIGLVAAVEFKSLTDNLEGFAHQSAGLISFRGKSIRYRVEPGYYVFEEQYVAVPRRTFHANLIAWGQVVPFEKTF